MGNNRKKIPDFFDENLFDPVTAATGGTLGRREGSKSSSVEESKKRRTVPQQSVKKKAGFYLSEELLDRFNRKFHELKLSGVSIENKSALIEAALTFSLDDIDLGESNSRVLRKLNQS